MVHDAGTSDNGRGTALGATPITASPQPGWVTLNEAREIAFTGEIVFDTAPQVRTYLDNGVVYFAERSGDGPIGARLRAEGLLDQAQLERGVVRVGDVEHLGRLFDRDPSVARDAIVVFTELVTEALVTELANETITTARSTAYRHHPSGIHRWFADRIDAASAVHRDFTSSLLDPRTIGEVAGLPMLTERVLADQLYIEWDEPIIGAGKAVDEPYLVDDFDDSLLQAILDGAAITADDEITVHDEITVDDEIALSADQSVESESPVEPVVSAGSGFEVVWPKRDTDAGVGPDTHDGPTANDLSVAPIEQSAHAAHDELVDDVPEDVADSVRRAIAVLESATAAPAALAPIVQPDQYDYAAVTPPASPSPLSAFAPPTADMSVEAIYARAIAADEAQATAQAVASGSSDIAASTSVEESNAVVPDDDSGDRSSALKRLIGSLRRKDR
jgi:hypothetical protein